MILFVYGSLRKGQYNHIDIGMSRVPFVGMAKTKPEFEMVSYGSYPGVLEPGKTAVVGELYEFPDKHWLFERINRMEESSGYKLKMITLADGRKAGIFVQRLRRVEAWMKPVVSGDWAEFHPPTPDADVAREMKNRINWAHENALYDLKHPEEEYA